MRDTYHKVYVPSAHVYRVAGPDTFRELDRTLEDAPNNAVVFPISMIDDLQQGKAAVIGIGGERVIEAITARMAKGEHTEVEGTRVNKIPFSPTLDVLVVMDDNDRETVHNIAKRVVAGESEPEYIVHSEGELLKIHAQRRRVSKPKFLQVGPEILETGMIHHTVQHNDGLSTRLASEDFVPADEAASLLGKDMLYPNQFIHFRSRDRSDYGVVVPKNPNAIVRNGEGDVIGIENLVVRYLTHNEQGRRLCVGEDVIGTDLLGIRPMDMEQYLALQFLLVNPNVQLGVVTGQQGSGKTLLSYAAAVEGMSKWEKESRIRRGMSDRDRQYRNAILFKPNDPFGGAKREVGYLPGDLYDKQLPVLGPFVDAHKMTSMDFPFKQMVLHGRHANDYGPQRQDKLRVCKRRGGHLPVIEAIELVNFSSLRGRSFDRSFILVDEAQNTTPYEMKTIIERAGRGSKIILMGDPRQVDNTDCSREMNGLTHAVRQFQGRPYFGMMSLGRNYRSPASDDARSWEVYNV